MWKIFIIIFGVLFGIFIPRSIYENYTDADLEDSTYEEYSYADSEDSVNEDYDPTKTDWENYGDTGSIMEIADTDWALENAPVFHVEQRNNWLELCIMSMQSKGIMIPWNSTLRRI